MEDALRVFAFLMSLSLAISCQKTETAAPPSPATTTTATTSTNATTEKTYPMNGKLVSRDAATKEVTIDNEEVPGGVMSPMTMAYDYRGGDVLSLPPDGTRITSTLHEKEGNYWVTDVKPRP
jgi:Cu/Ag efflux protein CusF